MIHFIKLTGSRSGRTSFVRAEEIQAAFDHDDIKNRTCVIVRGGRSMDVRETPDEILALLQAPVDPPEPA